MEEELKGILGTFGPELAKLDKSFTDSKERHFRLDPKKILASEGPNPSDAQPPQPPQPPQQHIEQQVQTPVQTPVEPQKVEDGQSEFSFDVDKNKIFDELDGIYNRLEKIDKTLKEIKSLLSNDKSKNT